jgi:hypothetical protein
MRSLLPHDSRPGASGQASGRMALLVESAIRPHSTTEARIKKRIFELKVLAAKTAIEWHAARYSELLPRTNEQADVGEG